MPIKLLITDLDNTLYDWVTFFTQAFRGMVVELVGLLGVSEDQLLAEFQAIHQHYGNSEQPFAVLDLPLLREKFPDLSIAELARKVDPALHQFNKIRKQTLQLYPGVADALGEITAGNIKVVGHTEAILANAYWRIKALDIEKFFTRLYTLEGKEISFYADGTRWTEPPEDFIKILPRSERKPNPVMIHDICRREGVDIAEACYVGDSLVRDISMAEAAGVKSVWARYGTQYDSSHWSYLVRVTHWTQDDVIREKDLKSRFGNVRPDYTIDSFRDLVPIVLN